MTTELKRVFGQLFGPSKVEGIVEYASPQEFENGKPELFIKYHFRRRGFEHTNMVTYPADSAYQAGDTLLIQTFDPNSSQHEILYNKSALNRSKQQK